MSRFVASYGPLDARLRNLELWAGARPPGQGPAAAVTLASGVEIATFDALDDVQLTDPAAGDIPIFDGDYWVNSQAYITTVPSTSVRNVITPTANNVTGLTISPFSASQSANPLVVPNIAFALATKTTGYTLTGADGTINADASGAGFSLTLPGASGAAGRHYEIKKTDSTGNTVTVAPTGGDTVEGGASAAISVPGTSLTFVSDGVSNWEIV